MPYEKYIKGYAAIISEVGRSSTKYSSNATAGPQYNKTPLNMYELVTLTNGMP